MEKVSELLERMAKSRYADADGFVPTSPDVPTTAPIAREQDPLIAQLPRRYAWAADIDADKVLRGRVPERCIHEVQNVVNANQIVFVGPSGSGKTTLAVRGLMFRGGLRRLFVPCWKLATARANHRLGDGEPPDVELAMSWRGVALLDDLGNHRDGALSAVSDVILARHDGDLPMWVTTELTAEAVEARFGNGIARRIFEGAYVINCGEA